MSVQASRNDDNKYSFSSKIKNVSYAQKTQDGWVLRPTSSSLVEQVSDKLGEDVLKHLGNEFIFFKEGILYRVDDLLKTLKSSKR